MELLMFCSGITTSAMDNPKNLWGILIGVMLMNGMLSTSSLASIVLPMVQTLRSSAIPSLSIFL